jgi:hypothetical protein
MGRSEFKALLSFHARNADFLRAVQDFGLA